MEFLVLARKLRPNRFEHLIGQETVVRALRNAIRTDRVAHAFLFTGSRGVGKTSTARILTKALNCEQPEDGEPCNTCDNCREITNNTSPDVYEIDAASNRGIDNIRELRENTKYAPVKSRYKTYIIDEVHMLTTESFNALLKTLEEPPPHVKFVLATTNPHRIPDTILSRCQRYDFARVPVGVLSDYLQQVGEQEGIRLSRHALESIARNAAGGVRDALTSVDQVVSYAGPEADDAQVLSILGMADHREVFALFGALLDRDLSAALQAFAELRTRGHDLGVLLEALLGAVKDFSLYVSLNGQLDAAGDHPPEALAFFAERRSAVDPGQLQQLFYLLLEVEEQLKRSEFAQACFEMGLIKACSVQPLVGVPELLAEVRSLSAGAKGSPAGAGRGGSGGAVESVPAASREAPSSEPHTASQAAPRAVPDAPPVAAPLAAPAAAPTASGDTDFGARAARAKARAREGGAARSAPTGSAGDADEAEPAPAAIPERPVADPGTRADLRAEADQPPGSEFQDEIPGGALSGGTAGSRGLEEGLPDDGTLDGGLPDDGPPDDGAPPPESWEERADDAGSAGATDEPDTEPLPGPANGAHGDYGTEAAIGGSPPSDPQLQPELQDEGVALCDDPRWRAAVEAVGVSYRLLAAKLRQAEVTALAPEGIDLVPADPANRPSAADLDLAAPFIAEAFGADAAGAAAFPIRLADDTTRKARPAHTITGRNRIAEQNRLAARREAAAQDPQVQRLLKHFPHGRIADIALSEEPTGAAASAPANSTEDG